mmetsp:Transcript_42721/g.68814  ORF Transcript_42721/g.68814 Transcript_42721/m.68814 type:complete len:202 (+) Transcript_42721:376-981(+)
MIWDWRASWRSRSLSWFASCVFEPWEFCASIIVVSLDAVCLACFFRSSIRWSSSSDLESRIFICSFMLLMFFSRTFVLAFEASYFLFIVSASSRAFSPAALSFAICSWSFLCSADFATLASTRSWKDIDFEEDAFGRLLPPVGDDLSNFFLRSLILAWRTVICCARPRHFGGPFSCFESRSSSTSLSSPISCPRSFLAFTA